MNAENVLLDSYESWGKYPKLKPSSAEFVRFRGEIPDFSHYKKPVLPYGCGKSYGDVCLNEGGVLLDVRAMNRFIAFDSETGTLRCEAGATISQILDFFLPLGWFLPATPGTKHITIGGAIANDVHGKNHHKGGTFGASVEKFELVRSGGERLVCSPEENSDLFCATIGGLGLTGLITWAQFRLVPCKNEYFNMESVKFNRLEEFFDINEDSEKDYDYTVAWIDCMASGGDLGRGLFSRGVHNESEPDELPAPPRKKAKTLPIEAPLINPLSTYIFNQLYYHKQQYKIEKSLVHYEPFFYPLDAVLHWNRAYGKNGFLQYQFLLPHSKAKSHMKKILKIISDSGASSFLTVMKTFGEVESPGMLSFPRPGVNLAIDFAMRGEKTLRFLSALDDLVRDAGGSIYPAKDARMSGEDFRRFYPNWKDFSEYIDPNFSSSFWRRVMK